MGCESQRISRVPSKDQTTPDGPPEQVTLNDFQLVKECRLAEGAFGKIWQCKDIKSGKQYALKEISLRMKENA